MTLKALPKDEWEITIESGMLVLSAVSQTMDDGSVFRDHKWFKLIDDSTDYPVCIADLEGPVFTVDESHFFTRHS